MRRDCEACAEEEKGVPYLLGEGEEMKIEWDCKICGLPNSLDIGEMRTGGHMEVVCDFCHNSEVLIVYIQPSYIKYKKDHIYGHRKDEGSR